MTRPPAAPLAPPRWTREQLAEARLQAIEEFRRERLEEPLADYLELLDRYRGVFEDFLERTGDLSRLDGQALVVLTGTTSFEAFRYLMGPPISTDDLMTLAGAPRISPRSLRADPEAVGRLVRVVLNGLDRRRFPWVSEGREPDELERASAILASAALIAAQRAATARRNAGKKTQEDRVKEALRAQGFAEIRPRRIPNLASAPRAGEFCGESRLGSRKADIVIGLWDARTMAIECKVSNSELNSVKRLNNDAAVKAVVWREELGALQVVPTAALSGVFALEDLVYAQDRGLTLFWAHDLAALGAWIRQTGP